MKSPSQLFFRRLSTNESQLLSDVALLLLRLIAGLSMALQHGLGKIQKLLSGDLQFPDPIGVGVTSSLFLAGMAEFFCALAVTLGIMTRLMSIPVAFTMVVAAFVIHASDPFERKELAILYLTIFTALTFLGGGRFSLEKMLWKTRY